MHFLRSRHPRQRRRLSSAVRRRIKIGSVVGPLLLPAGFLAAIALAPTAAARIPGEDTSILCSNERQYVDDLAAIGITPTTTARDLANAGSKICGYLMNEFHSYPLPSAAAGLKNGAAAQLVRQNPSITWEQANGWVQAAIDNMCPDSATGMYFQQ